MEGDSFTNSTTIPCSASDTAETKADASAYGAATHNFFCILIVLPASAFVDPLRMGSESHNQCSFRSFPRFAASPRPTTATKSLVMSEPRLILFR